MSRIQNSIGLTLLSLLLVLTGVACTRGEVGKPEPLTRASEMLRSAILEYDGKLYQGVIDDDAGTITIGGIAIGEKVTDVRFNLSEGSTVSPNPETLIGRLPRESVWNFTCFNGKTKSYKLILSDYQSMRPSDMPSDLGWKLVWSDEFEGNDFDGAVWSKTPRRASDWNNYMADHSELFEVSNGTLKLRAIANTEHPDDPVPFLTGGLWTQGKKTFLSGRIDIKARFDVWQGFWPAIWLIGNGPHTWPLNGEVDIMEHLNYDDYVYHTVHSGYTQRVSKSGSSATAGIDKTGFNIYSVILGSDEITFLVNDIVTHRYKKASPEVDGQFPFTVYPSHLILSAQMGGGWVGQPALPMPSPAVLEVDFVRHYEYQTAKTQPESGDGQTDAPSI
ncbi:MAG: family 16 glycosylhydrolase [Porphyromonas sp.]|nr:family 16 glycosylhydrolase [Bacteroidales bacterium]MDY3100691.1 family 16 glycosylhydrolase [Porphyromonas sp.]